MPEVPSRALINAGFIDIERAKNFLQAEELYKIDPNLVVSKMAHAQDQDQAWLLALRLADRHPKVIDIFMDPDSCQGLVRLLGSSSALGEFLIRCPEALDIVRKAPSGEFVQVSAEQLVQDLLASIDATQSD